jgi:hypothetical protein
MGSGDNISRPLRSMQISQPASRNKDNMKSLTVCFPGDEIH